MSRKFKWMLLLALTAVGTAWLIGSRVRAADEPSGGEEDRVAGLSARIDALEQEVAGLKQLLAATQTGRTQVLLHEEFTPAIPAPPYRMRDRTPSGEINGVPYYVLPLGSSGPQ